MTRNEKEIKKIIENALATTEMNAVNSVGVEGKFPYMVGSYQQTLK